METKLFRSDSLFARLKTTEAREQVFAWMAEDCLGPEQTAKRIASEFGVATSAAAVCELQKRCGLGWRLQRATQLAKQAAADLPADLEESTRLRMRQLLADSKFENLSRQEVLAFASFDLQEEKFRADVARTQAELKQKDVALKQRDVALKQKDRSLQQSDRRVKLLESNAAAAKKLLVGITKGKGKSRGLTAKSLKEIEEAAKLL